MTATTPAPAPRHDAAVGEQMHAMLGELFPLLRGLGGEGSRRTLARIAELIPLKVHEVPAAAKVFDWTVPQQWTFRAGWIKDASGRKLVDAAALNLHVVTHSQPVHRVMPFAKLRPHLHSRPDQPGVVPYCHTFYADDWGFCVSHEQLQAMQRDVPGPLEVCIDADLGPGPLLYGQCTLGGTADNDDEVVFSAHACHPSMANDNLSGVVVQAYLAAHLMQRPAAAAGRRRPTYRFVFAPATIGALAWLGDHQDRLDRIIGGATLANLGDGAPVSYRRSRPGDTLIDRAAQAVLGSGHVSGFDPTGGDERQFGSPGLNLPIGALMRSGPGDYPQYHTSADDLTFVTPGQLAQSLEACVAICDQLERRYNQADAPPRGSTPPTPGASHPINPVRLGEPQLGRRGVLAAISQASDAKQLHHAVLWTLNLADGTRPLAAIASRSGLPQPTIERAAVLLSAFDLLESPRSSTTASTDPHGTAS